MVNVARLFREEDVGASSAHVIEAIRLAETLAAMRVLQVPGIDELREAAVTTICEGSEVKLKLIEERLITGSKVGSVPDSVPTVPLQKDIEQAVKSARLTKYWEVPEEQWLSAESPISVKRTRGAGSSSWTVTARRVVSPNFGK